MVVARDVDRGAAQATGARIEGHGEGGSAPRCQRDWERDAAYREICTVGATRDDRGDLEVEQLPAETIAGRDPQLEKAIEVMMAELEENPPSEPVRPPSPVRVRQ